jgi:Domain of unknown function (DUF222)
MGSSTVATADRADARDLLGSVDDATRLVRRARAAQLDRVGDVVSSGRWHVHGYRSPLARLTSTSNESPVVCAVTLELAEHVQHMPIARDRFGRGDLAESALRLLARAWHPTIAEVFARDEQMLVGWALNLAHRDFRMVLDTWRMHADPDRCESTPQEQFESRSLHLSELLDGMGRLDGLLDPEGTKLVREAISALAIRTDHDTRTPQQRRADALVTMARSTLANHQHAPGKKRRRPKVIATIDYFDLVARTGGGTIDTNAGRIVVTTHTIRRVACDAGIHRLITAPDGSMLNYGRQTRTVSDPLYDTLVVRDHGCRVGGCPVGPDGCDAHHANHWADLGETEPENLILLCWYHHHLVHEQHWSLQPLGAGHFVLTDQHGIAQPMRPPMTGLTLPQLPLPLTA